MITQDNANHKTREHYRYDDILENAINPRQLNSSAVEQYLVRVNVGSKRRIRNHHQERLERYKTK